MFETPDQFRDRIRETLKGTFSKEASQKGITTLQEEDPQQKNVNQNTQTPPMQDNFKKSIQAAFENISMSFKAKAQLQSGTKLTNAGSVSQKSIDNMYKAINDPNMDMRKLSDAFKKSIGVVIDSVVKDVENISKKNQASQNNQQNSQQGNQQNQNQPQDQNPKQLNAAEGHGDNLQIADEAYGDGIVNHVGPQTEQPIEERNDPISVDAMQGILKFATPGQIADAIKKMTPEDFQQFTNGLQKTALDVIAKSVNAGGVSGPSKNNGDGGMSQGKNNNPTGSGGNTDKEGNLKLGDL
jgi:hypothetical protein